MQQLPLEFVEGGFRFIQQVRNNHYAIYLKQRVNHAAFSYEVIRIRVRPEERIFKTLCPEREIYPANEAWGTDGFSFNTIAAATTCFKNLSDAPASVTSPEPGSSVVATPPKTQNQTNKT